MTPGSFSSQLHTTNIIGQGKRGSNTGLPINLVTNDITFVNGYNNNHKYGVQGDAINNSMQTGNQKLMQMNKNIQN